MHRECTEEAATVHSDINIQYMVYTFHMQMPYICWKDRTIDTYPLSPTQACVPRILSWREEGGWEAAKENDTHL